MLTVENLSLELETDSGAARILDGVSFSVARGEIVGLIGESGSGKSMTVNSIARLLPKTAAISGSITFAGKDVLALSPSALARYRDTDIGIIYQDPQAHVNPVGKVGEFVTEALRVNRGISRAAAQERAVSLFQEVGISDARRRLEQYPHQFSGGMLQRAVIAAALATDPKLILADEPTTALDVTTQAEIIAVLRALCRGRGLGMLFVTHDLELAAAICDRICVMYQGRIVEVLAAEALHTAAQHPYTNALLRSRPRLDAKVARLPMITDDDRREFGHWPPSKGVGA